MLTQSLLLIHPSSLRPHPFHRPSSLILISSVGQHRLDSLDVAVGNNCVNVQPALTLGALFRKDVARMRMTAFDLAARGRAKAFGRALVCLQLWHNKPS